MAILTADQIFAISLASEVVSVPEWGGDVKLVEMDMVTRCRYEEALRALKLVDGTTVNQERWRELYPAVLVAFSITEDDGKRPMASPELAAKLSASSHRAIERLFPAADRLSMASPASLEAAEKN